MNYLTYHPTSWVILLVLFVISSTNAQTCFERQNIVSEGNDIEPQLIHTADLDGDGDNDIISGSSLCYTISWYENIDGLGNFGAKNAISLNPGQVASIFTTDIDGDGDIDVLCANGCHGEILYYKNTNGEGSFGPKQIIATEVTMATVVYAADIDNDGDMDVISSSWENHEIAWYQNDGFGNFGSPLIISTSIVYVVSIFAADFDGDGDIDILSGSASGDLLAWHENIDGCGNFNEPKIISSLVDYVVSVSASDLDADGDMDVISVSNNDSKIAWYENDGSGNFGTQKIISTSSCANEAHSVDVDGDGDMDIITCLRNVIWYENIDGQGTFEERERILLDDNVISIYPIDIDGDLDIDIPVASRRDDKIVWLENYTLEILEQPLDVEICPNYSTLFMVLAKDATDYQWQVDEANGFYNIIDNTIYSGEKTSVLNITNVSIAMSGYKYRCILSNQGGSLNSIESTLIVSDIEVPVISSFHPNKSLYPTINCDTSLPDYSIEVDAFDNCDNNLDIIQIPNPGINILGLINPVTLIVIDDADNRTSVSFNVSVRDTLNPRIVCIEDKTIQLKPEQNSYIVIATEFDPEQIEDNCAVASIFNSYNNLGTLKEVEFPIGKTTVNWTVTDSSSNFSECQQDIIIEPYIDIGIYPNPTDGIAYINSGTNIIHEIIIYDINGKPIFENRFANSIKLIDLRDQCSGVYFVKFITNNGIIKRKIIKQLGKSTN